MKGIRHYFIFPFVKHAAWALILIFFSCKNSKLIPEIRIENITFGSGGGFTGRITTYSLSPDGQLNLVEGEKIDSIKKIDLQQMNEILEKAKALKGYQYNTSGNMNAFLEIKSDQYTQRD